MGVNNSDLFKIHALDIDVNVAAPFPLYLFFPLNNKFVLLRPMGLAIGMKKSELLKRRDIKFLWVPEEYRANYLNYMKQKNHDGESSLSSLLVPTIESDAMSESEKKNILAEVAQNALRSLNELREAVGIEQSEELDSFCELVDEILLAAGKRDKLYLDVLLMKRLRSASDHSVFAASLSLLFAMSLGYTDLIKLADLAVAAIFHDAGLASVNPQLLYKSEDDWTRREKSAFANHVKESQKMLQDSGLNFSDLVYTIISDHHENSNGKGYPSKKHSFKIEELSQVLHLANWFERLMLGRNDGQKLSPNESFQQIYNSKGDSENGSEVKPEIIEHIFSGLCAEQVAS